jgi:pimeloyl-ACP methyl ester carboxylesterase
VAACNNAAFEWIHHEHVARNAGGMSYEQLSIVGQPPLKPSSSSSSAEGYSYTVPTSSTGKQGSGESLTKLQAAALAFADASTRNITVPTEVFDGLKNALKEELEVRPIMDKVTGEASTVEQQMVEATAIVGGYNLVSRFLVALDVDDKSTLAVPVPIVAKVPADGTSGNEGLHAVYLPVQGEPTDKTIILVNSLLTNYRMWKYTWERLNKSYNIIMYDQRGHGASFVPASGQKCTMDELAGDVVTLLDHFKVDKAWAVIGISQGGATALNFAIDHPGRAHKIVACDTQAKSPEANIKAWDERIELAKKQGMGALADATIPRWFGPGSSFDKEKDFGWLKESVEGTTVDGFAAGAGALQGYDLLAKGLVEVLAKRPADSVMLLAGEMDGKLPQGLEALGQEVEQKGGSVEVEVIAKGGHLPCVNEPEAFLNAVCAFLEK